MYQQAYAVAFALYALSAIAYVAAAFGLSKDIEDGLIPTRLEDPGQSKKANT